MAARRLTKRGVKRSDTGSSQRKAKSSSRGSSQRQGKSSSRSSSYRTTSRRPGARKWSARVTAHSNALDLDPRVFTWKDPRRIAASLKRSAERSKRRKSSPYRSAMSMLTFYINRGGRSLAADQKRVLERAKHELRKQFGKAPQP
jgi:hypothetical protein